jgi:ketosteroid isomerase-like protein
MSQEPMAEEIALLRRFNAAIEARDVRAFDLLAADFVYRPIATFTETDERRGRDEFRRFMLDWWESWEEGGWTLETVRVYGDALVALLRFGGRAKASGIETVGGVFEVFRFRDGLITSVEDFTDSRRAIEAAEGTA